MIPIAECEHKNTQKNGIKILSGAKYQRLQCKDCGKTINGERLE